MNIAIIPARSGSKRIKNKNIKKFLTHPMIYWPIKRAMESNIFDEIIVSTDCRRIKSIAENLGCNVPFLRPKKISGDRTGIDEVIFHSLNLLKKIKPKFVCCISATSPLISSKDLIAGFNRIKKNKLDFVFSAAKYDYPVQRSFQFKKKKIKNVISKIL